MKRKKNIIAMISKAAAAFYLLVGMVLSAGVNSKAAAVNVDNNNDDIFTAANINLNTTYAGSCNMKDEDWYHFVIPSTAKGSYFKVVFGPENENSVTLKDGWEFYVYKKGEAEPFIEAGKWGYGITSKVSTYNIPFGPGEYYLKIDSHAWISGYDTNDNYNLKVEFTDNAHWETEYNGTWDIANPINVNETYHGNLFMQTDEDCYTFTLPKSGEVVVTLGPNASVDITKLIGGWKLYLYKDNAADPSIKLEGIKVMTSSAKCNLSAGTYRIRISGRDLWQTYDFKVAYNATQTSTTNSNTTVTSLKKSNVTVSSVKSNAKKKYI